MLILVLLYIKQYMIEKFLNTLKKDDKSDGLKFLVVIGIAIFF